jgi:hypothetical protein
MNLEISLAQTQNGHVVLCKDNDDNRSVMFLIDKNGELNKESGFQPEHLFQQIISKLPNNIVTVSKHLVAKIEKYYDLAIAAQKAV